MGEESHQILASKLKQFSKCITASVSGACGSHNAIPARAHMKERQRDTSYVTVRSVALTVIFYANAMGSVSIPSSQDKSRKGMKNTEKRIHRTSDPLLLSPVRGIKPETKEHH